MSGNIQSLSYYLSYPFVRYALIVGILVSLCASLLGVTLVLKRYSFIGDGLSHVAFGAVAIASIFNLSNDTLVVLPITIVAAVLLLRTGKNAKVKGDAAIAMLSVGALATGYMILHIFSTGANVSGDVCTTLFGSTSILTLSINDVWLTLGLSVVVIALFIILYNRLFSITFDENFAKASGLKVERINLVVSIIIAIIIVMGMKLVGSLLISALIVFPAMASMRIMSGFKGVIISSLIISFVCASLGMVLAILLSLPVGATIVEVEIAAFLISLIIGRIKGV